MLQISNDRLITTEFLSGNKSVKIWNLSNQTVEHYINLNDSVDDIRQVSEFQVILSLHYGSLYLWNINTNQNKLLVKSQDFFDVFSDYLVVCVF